MRMLTEKRRNEVLATISRDGSVGVNALAKALGVSMETIRKDIRFWEEKGVLRKTHGGALLHCEDALVHINNRIVQNLEAKNAIAAKAMDFVPERSTVFIDCGSTAVCAARQLSVRSGLTVITGSLLVAGILSESANRVMLLGGALNGESMGTSGIWASSAMKSIFVDVALLDCSGVKGFDGPVVNDFANAELKRVVLERSKLKVVIADSTKFEISGLVAYCGWNDIDAFITDADVDPERCRELSRQTRMVLVEKSPNV